MVSPVSTYHFKTGTKQDSKSRFHYLVAIDNERQRLFTFFCFISQCPEIFSVLAQSSKIDQYPLSRTPLLLIFLLQRHDECQPEDELSQSEDLEYQRRRANNRSIFKEGFQSWGKIPYYLTMSRSLKSSKCVKADPPRTLSVSESPFHCRNPNQRRKHYMSTGAKHDITITVS